MTLYAVTIFLGAFLLFQVQPIVARYILPWYGGSPAVWTTCMLFFQLLLMGGYLYAHLVGTRLDPRRQPIVHAGLLLLAVALLPITPDESWKPLEPANPTWQIVTLLLATVGLPYLVVATSSPLLQLWFSRTEPGRSPYRLFALSNAGSLLGLVTYPFLLEPLLPTGTQTRLWSATFGLYVLVCGLCAVRVFRSAPTAAPPRVEAPSSPVPTRDRVLWLLLAACGSLMLLATTTQMTQDVAVIPFLWVLPLGLYLLTFIICFDHERWYDRRVWSPVLALALAAVVYLFWSRDLTLVQQIVVYAVMVFAACMVCHGELVKLKPATAHLTSFYLMVATGGALGGVFASLVAPAIFNGFWEYLVGTGVLLAVCSDLHRPPGRLSLVKDVAWAVGIGTLVLYFVAAIRDDQDEMIAATRNFYGLLRVYDKDIGEDGQPVLLRSLYHGEILHGSQLLAERRRREPLSYYGVDTGVAFAIEEHPRRDAETPASEATSGLRIGVVGLGAGTIAAHGRSGDSLRFYEINPEVERIANEYFSYLRDTQATTEVVLGDARVSLERELREQGSRQFDVLVLDAFSGDAIPIHLLTLEAAELYWQHLRDDGVLLAHISNKHLSLHPVVRAGAEAFDKRFVMMETASRGEEISGSTWVAVTSNGALLSRLFGHAMSWPSEPPQTIRWTDDFSSLLGVLD